MEDHDCHYKATGIWCVHCTALPSEDKRRNLSQSSCVCYLVHNIISYIYKSALLCFLLCINALAITETYVTCVSCETCRAARGATIAPAPAPTPAAPASGSGLAGTLRDFCSRHHSDTGTQPTPKMWCTESILLIVGVGVGALLLLLVLGLAASKLYFSRSRGVDVGGLGSLSSLHERLDGRAGGGADSDGTTDEGVSASW